MSFQKMKDALQAQGWYVAWAHPCCQTCAWQEIPASHPDGPYEGQDINFDKLLFNHEQDCQMDCEYNEEKGEYVLPEGMTHDDYCTFPTYIPEHTKGSYFCFNGQDNGLQNLIDALPIIKSAGCQIDWNQKSDSRIFIRWP